MVSQHVINHRGTAQEGCEIGVREQRHGSLRQRSLECCDRWEIEQRLPQPIGPNEEEVTDLADFAHTVAG